MSQWRYTSLPIVSSPELRWASQVVSECQDKGAARRGLYEVTRADLADFAYFLVIAKYGSFRAAATSMGITTSVRSHAITALEVALAYDC